MERKRHKKGRRGSSSRPMIARNQTWLSFNFMSFKGEHVGCCFFFPFLFRANINGKR